MSRRGRPPYPDVLTPREWEVAELIARGMTNRQIAAALGLSFSGAKFHVSEVLTKLGLESRAEVAAWLAVQRSSRLAGFAAVLGWPLRRMGEFGWPKVAAATALGGAVVAFVVLVLLVLTTSRDEDAVTVVDQGFTVVQGTHLTYAFLVENSDPRLALDGATYHVRFHDDGGALVLEREGSLPLVLPGQTAAVAEEAIVGASEASRMSVTLSGGRLLPADGLPAFHPVPMEDYSGGGPDLTLTQVMTTLYNPYPGALEGALVTAVFLGSNDRILGGATQAVGALPPGNERTEMWLRFGPSEPDMGPRVVFYVAPRSGTLAELRGLQQAATQAPEPSFAVRWRPAQAPLYEGEESPQPFVEQYGDFSSRLYVVEGDGPAALVHETPRYIRRLWWQGDSTALHLDVVTEASRANDEPYNYVIGAVLVGVPDGSMLRTLLAPPSIPAQVHASTVDGRVVYQPSEHELYLIEPDGSSSRLEGLGEQLEFVSWSPRGDAIVVFVYEDASHRIQVDGYLYVVPLADGAAQRIEPPMEGLQGRSAAWSPDGSRVAFLADGEPRTFENAARGDLFVFDARTGDARRLLVHDGFLPDPVWTADGRYLLLGGDLVDAATGDVIRLTATREDAIGGSVSPDGRFFVVTEQPSQAVCPGDELANRTLLRDLTTGDERVLLDCEDGFYFTFSRAGEERWTADGRKLVLLSSSIWGSHGHVWKASLVDIETGELTTLVERPEEGRVSAFVSPDGSRIATTGDAVRVFDADGALLAAHEAPEGYEVRVAAWSRDGSKLAFVAVPAQAFLGP